MKWENYHGVSVVASRHYICKKDAALFFARTAPNDKLYGDESRLRKAVEEGKIQTKQRGRRTLYNMWDCMQNCKVL